MRKSKSTAVLAAVFSAAINMNGCTYGPSPDYEFMDKGTTAVSVVSEAEKDVSAEVSSDISADEAQETSEQ